MTQQWSHDFTRLTISEAHNYVLLLIEDAQQEWFRNRNEVTLRRIYGLAERANELRAKAIWINESIGMGCMGNRLNDQTMQALWPWYDPDKVSNPATIISLGERIGWPRV